MEEKNKMNNDDNNQKTDGENKNQNLDENMEGNKITLQKKPSFKDKLKLAKQDAKFFRTNIDIYHI